MGNLINASTEACVKRYLPDPTAIESVDNICKVIESYDYIPVVGRKRDSHLLTNNSTLLESSREHVAPIAKLVSRLGINELKTYSYSPEIRDVGRGQILASRASYSILFEKTDEGLTEGCREAEILITAIKLVKTFTKFLSTEICIEISNTKMLSAIANMLEIEDLLDYKALIKFFASSYNGDDAWKICRGNGKNTAILQRLMEISCEPFENFEKRLHSILGGDKSFINDILNGMRKVHNMIIEQAKGCTGLNVLYSLRSANYKRISYHAGMTFTVTAYRKTNNTSYNKRTAETPVEIIYGGRIDNLIEGFRPQDSAGQMLGCSLTFKAYEMYTFIKDFCDIRTDYPRLDISVYTGVSVLVASHTSEMQAEVVEVAAELWYNNIRADILCDELIPGSEKSLLQYRKRGCNYLITIKKHDATFHAERRVLLRNLKAHKGDECSIQEAVEEIKKHQFVFDNFTAKREKDLIDTIL